MPMLLLSLKPTLSMYEFIFSSTSHFHYWNIFYFSQDSYEEGHHIIIYNNEKKKHSNVNNENLLNKVMKWSSLVAHTVKNSAAIQETPVRLLGWKDPLEKGMATHSSILAWRILWTEETGGPVHGVAKRHDWVTNICIYPLVLKSFPT